MTTLDSLSTEELREASRILAGALVWAPRYDRTWDNTGDGSTRDQHVSGGMEYTPEAPALAADPSPRRGFVVRGSGE